MSSGHALARTRRRAATCIAAALALTALAAAGARAAEDSPQAVVGELHANLVAVMKQAVTLGYQGRFERLAPALARAFDTPFMAEKSVGRHWKEMSEADQARLVETIRLFMTANYAGRFDGYSGQSFETLQEEPSLHGTVLVHTRLVNPGEEPVQLNYRLRPLDGGWKIIDVYLNGTVSEIALRRSEYSSLIKRAGVNGLIAALHEKIDQLAHPTPARAS